MQCSRRSCKETLEGHYQNCGALYRTRRDIDLATKDLRVVVTGIATRSNDDLSMRLKIRSWGVDTGLYLRIVVVLQTWSSDILIYLFGPRRRHADAAVCSVQAQVEHHWAPERDVVSVR